MSAPLTTAPILLEPAPAALTRLGDLAALLDRAEPATRRAFLELVRRARGLRSLEQIATLLEAGQLDRALDVFERASPPFFEAIQAAYIAAGQQLAAEAGRHVGEALAFDQVNDRAAVFLREHRAALLVEMRAEQRAATSELLAEFADQGTDPRVQARILRRSIGLTSRQARAVANYRRLLQQGSAEALERALRDRRFDSITRAAVRGERPLTRAQIDRMVARYQERYVAYRARVIARTETVRAVHAGQEEMLSQLVDQGLVRPDQVRREWRTARDERVRPSHVAMHGQRQKLGDPFVSGDGYRLRFPGDPAAPASETAQCRCVLAVRLPRLRQARAAADAAGGVA